MKYSNFSDDLKSRYQKLAEIKVNISSQYAHKWLIKAYVQTNIIPLVQVNMVCPCVLTGGQFGVCTGVELAALFLSNATTSFE